MFAEVDAYNARSFLTDLLNKGGSTTLSEFGGSTPSTAMTYDALGDVASVKANMPAAPGSYSGTTSYQYDGKTELTQEASTRSGGYTNADSYDLAENPTQVRGVAQPTANADNQLPVSGVVFDGNGNPSKVEGLTASFDIENRATALGSVTNTWGANGLRASKGSTYFLYDGSVPVCELSSTGSVTATNTFGGAGLISRHTSGGSTFYTFDEQGNVAQRYTSTGSLVSSDLYDAFGKGTSTGSGDVFGYEGQAGYYTDTSTGLILCGHRFYDSAAGRFINRDPVGYNGGVNLYGYTGNNPIRFIDPSGFVVDPVGDIIGGIAVGAVIGVAVAFAPVSLTVGVTLALTLGLTAGATVGYFNERRVGGNSDDQEEGATLGGIGAGLGYFGGSLLRPPPPEPPSWPGNALPFKPGPYPSGAGGGWPPPQGGVNLYPPDDGIQPPFPSGPLNSVPFLLPGLGGQNPLGPGGQNPC